MPQTLTRPLEDTKTAALPSIQHDLGYSQSSLAWVVNAYLIAFGGLLLLSGRFGDLLGRKRVLMAGLGVFTFASLLCGVAWSQETLVAARFVQGVGGAMTSAVILGMIFTMFPEPREQAKAIGVYGFVASAGGPLGLPAGAVLITSCLMLTVYTIVKPAAEDGWGSAQALGLLALSAGLLAAFVVRES